MQLTYRPIRSAYLFEATHVDAMHLEKKRDYDAAVHHA